MTDPEVTLPARLIALRDHLKALERFLPTIQEEYPVTAAGMRFHIHESLALLTAWPAPQPSWQPMETAPRDGRAIIGLDADCIRADRVSWKREYLGWFSGDYTSHRSLVRRTPKFWAALPSPPGAPPPTTEDETDQSRGVDHGHAPKPGTTA